MPLIEPGAAAPLFALNDQHHTMHRLADYRGRSVVLYFYPKDDTSGCTTQACAFQAALPDVSALDAVVLGVSILDERSKAKFATKHGLSFPLLADADHAVADAYGVWQEKRMYGRAYMGIARVTYVIDPQGIVAKRWDAVKVDDHAQEVLTALRG